MTVEIVNQQEDEDVYPNVFVLEELEPTPDAIDPFSGRKMWSFPGAEVWAFEYKDAADIYDYCKQAASFSL